MQMKSLKLQGFKSFCQEREISLLPGVTAIVGPNGCGKSNIVDAICWVLGEQSPRRLRGRKMEEILFNGSEHLPPSGMARVALQLTRKHRGFPHPFTGCEELCVERLLFRTGESEYRINQSPVRLKDVVDLFMDTGTGNRTYSIIEQGHIGEIINSGPEKTRSFIEGAAGVQKFKSRKEAASRKMEATGENLRHIEAILSEIRRQMNSLNRQAQKARRYQKIKEEIRVLECSSAANAYGEICAREREKNEDKESISREIAVLTAEVGEEEATIETMRTELILQKEEGEQKQGELWKVLQEQNQLENRRLYLKQSQAEGTVKIEEVRRQTERAREQLISAQSEAADLSKRIGEMKSRELWISQEVGKARSGYQGLVDQERSLQKEIDELKDRLFTYMAQRAELHNSQIALHDKKNDLERRCEKDAVEIGQLKNELEALRQYETDLKLSLKTAKRCRSFLALQRTCLEIHKGGLKKEYDDAKLAAETLHETLRRKSSRLYSLLELQQSYEGCQDGVKAIMQKHSKDAKTNGGILGLVADFIETGPEYEVALESALGDRLQYVVVEAQQDGLQAVEYLKSGTLGRGSFIPVQLRGGSDVQYSASPLGVPLLNVVQTKEGFRTISEYLIGDVVVVDSLNEGLELWRQNGSHNRIVTREGDLLDPRGVITGGRMTGAESKVFRSKREIRELELEVDILGQEHDQKQIAVEHLLRRLRFNEEDLDHLQQRVYQYDIQILRGEKDLQQIFESLKRNCQRSKILETESGQYQEEVAQWEHKEGQNEVRRLELEEICAEGEKTLADLNSRISEVSAGKDRLRAEFNEKELEAKLIGEKRVGLETLQEQMRCKTLDILSLIQEKEGELESAAAKVRSAAEELEANEARNADIEKAKQDLQTDLARQNSAIQDRSLLLGEKEDWVRLNAKHLENSRKNQDALHLELVEIRLRKENLRSQIMEKHQLDLEVPGLFEPSGLDEVLVRERLERAYAAIKGLGEINPNAIEEFEDLQSRHSFYKEQYDDLCNSMDSLQKLVQRINRITKTRFMEAFSGVNEKFQAVFPVLFGGGRAFLELENEGEPLESGVVMVAQPPGKKLQNINLFSGGEKTMAALALILAIFQYRPSPFCILDEVDAALDDMNVGRFNEIIRSISDDAQFILITHNKQTMEIAHTLYGITMEMPGVSQVVSVNLEGTA